MNLLEQVTHSSYKEVKDLLLIQHQLIEDELFICTVGEFCEKIALFSHQFPHHEKASMGFAYQGYERSFVNRGLHTLPEWSDFMGNTFTHVQATRIHHHLRKIITPGHPLEIEIEFAAYNPEALRDLLLGPELAQVLFHQKIALNLETKPDSKKPKI